MKQEFTQCTRCNVWSNVPKNFNESKYFAQCPKCRKPMYLIRGYTPKEIGLDDRTRVEAGLMSQGGY